MGAGVGGLVRCSCRCGCSWCCDCDCEYNWGWDCEIDLGVGVGLLLQLPDMRLWKAVCMRRSSSSHMGAVDSFSGQLE
jgi:hypothetical protein